MRSVKRSTCEIPTGAFRLKANLKPYWLSSFHYAIFSVPCTLTDLMVTKRKETTRSHPEHGRKDFHRRQYSEGSLPGR